MNHFFGSSERVQSALISTSEDPLFLEMVIDLSLEIFGGYIEYLVALLHNEYEDKSAEETEKLIKSRFAYSNPFVRGDDKHYVTYQAQRIFSILHIVPVRIRCEEVPLLHNPDGKSYLILDVIGPSRLNPSINQTTGVSPFTIP